MSRNEVPCASRHLSSVTPAELIKRHATVLETKNLAVNQSVHMRLWNFSLSPGGWFLDAVTSFQTLQ